MKPPANQPQPSSFAVRLFMLDRVYMKPSLSSVVSMVVVLLFVGFLSSVFTGESQSNGQMISLSMLVGLLCYVAVIWVIVRIVIINGYVQSVKKHAQGNNSMPNGLERTSIARLGYGTKTVAAGRGDETVLSCYEMSSLNTKDANGVLPFRLQAAVWDQYVEDKYGLRSKANQYFYTVLSVQLDRALPRILFDSRRAKRSQFRYVYLGSQKLSVQSGFDEYFDTYVPEGYAIDSLSFVTPEAMEHMIAASRYDLEIIDDRLYLYGPLLRSGDAMAMIDCGQDLARQLNDNIDTYRDNRLQGEARKQQVGESGRLLLENPWQHSILATLGLLLNGLSLYYFIQNWQGNPTGFPAAMLLAMGLPMLMFGIGFYVQTSRRNAYIRAKYQQPQQSGGQLR